MPCERISQNHLCRILSREPEKVIVFLMGRMAASATQLVNLFTAKQPDKHRTKQVLLRFNKLSTNLYKHVLYYMHAWHYALTL